jgi:mitochondrial fission protein ELM1
MCAEACASGKPVYIFASENVTPPKYKRLHETLYQRGMARPLDPQASLHWHPSAPLDDVGYVAQEIRTRFAEIF